MITIYILRDYVQLARLNVAIAVTANDPSKCEAYKTWRTLNMILSSYSKPQDHQNFVYPNVITYEMNFKIMIFVLNNADPTIGFKDYLREQINVKRYPPI